MKLLSLQEVTKIFGGLIAVNDLSFSVDAGSIVGLTDRAQRRGQDHGFQLHYRQLHAGAGPDLF